jgi:hypothetical protein
VLLEGTNESTCGGGIPIGDRRLATAGDALDGDREAPDDDSTSMLRRPLAAA